MRNGYLIGAVDHATPADQNWKSLLEKAIEKSDLDLPQITLYDPAGPWKLCNEFVHSAFRRKFIEKVNTAAMDESHFAIANLPQSIFSVGSIIEIDMFWREHKPVIIATDIAFGKNVYLANRTSRDFYIEYAVGAKPDVWIPQALEKLETLHASVKSSWPTDDEAGHMFRNDLRPERNYKNLEKACGSIGVQGARY